MKNISLRKKMYACFTVLEFLIIGMLIFSCFCVRKALSLDGAEAKAYGATFSYIVLAQIVCLIPILVGIVYFIMHSIRINLELIKESSIALAEGNATEEIKKINNDEFGAVIDEFNEVIRVNNQQAELVKTISTGNLCVDIESRGSHDILNNSLHQLVEGNRTSIAKIRESAMQVDVSASEVASASEALAQGSTEQASAIEEITASIDDITEKTKDNAQKADDAASVMAKAISNMRKGNEQMEHMVTAMNDINVSSESISKVIKVIDDIAFQTNILALNAAVEAARAGEAGMGFAVVAEEVRNLAAKSASAAAETAEMIEDSIKKVHHGKSIADDTMKSIEEVTGVVADTAEIIKGIAEASNYQATAIAQIDQAVSQVSQVVSNNSATSEECAAASLELSSQAKHMIDLVSVYRLSENDVHHTGSYGSGGYGSVKNRNEQIISLGDGFGKY